MADVTKYGTIYVSRCQNNTSSGIVCEDSSTIDQIVNTIDAKVVMLNTYFDFNDYIDPIQTFIDLRSEHGITGFTRYMNLYMRENEAFLKDNYMSAYPQEVHKKFFHVDIYHERTLDNANEHFIVFTIYKSYMKVFYERHVYMFLDLLGNLGGLFEVLSGIGYVSVIIFASKTFNYSLIKRLYQIDTMA